MAKITDRLKDKIVTINILVLPQHGDTRDDRAVMVMVGCQNESPTVRNGRFSDIDSLIQEAWIGHGQVVVASGDVAEIGAGDVLAEADLDNTLASMYDDDTL